MRALTESGTFVTNADLERTEYVLWMGTYPGSTGKSFQGISKRTMEAVQSGRAKMVVFDPVLSGGCVTPGNDGITWVSMKPATNGALCSGMVRWILENRAYNAEFLSFPHYAAGVKGGYASYTNAAHLVVDDESHADNRKFLTPAAAGIDDVEEKLPNGSAVTHYVVVDGETGEPVLNTACGSADLEFVGEVNGVRVRTAFSLMRESVMEHTVSEYADICGVDADVIESVAREFTSHGVKASANAMGGTAVANGTDASFGYRILNALIGANQMVGGAMARRVSAKTTADGPRYKLSSYAGKPKVSASNATYISRNQKPWKKTDEYAIRFAAGESDPQPKLPWFPGTAAADNQALLSIVNQYPYSAKILVSWMSNTIQATPGAFRDEVVERLKDPKVVPLFIACDVVMGEMSALADYFVPDTNPFESFGVVTQEGYWAGRGNAVRWQALEPGSARIASDRYASYEAFICDVAKACGLPGFGEDAIAAADGTLYPLEDACDFFLKAVANLAYDTDPVEDIAPDEVKMQGLDELPSHWRASVSDEEWPKVLRVLSRGGRFWPVEQCIGEEGRSAYAANFLTLFYSETAGSKKNPKTGRFLSGTLGWTPELLQDFTPIAERYSSEDYPFAGNNYKPRFRSISMQANSPIMRDICAHNYIEVHEDDAASLGVSDGDTIRVVGPDGAEMRGEAMVRAGVTPGTFSIAYGYGHMQYGCKNVEIDGEVAAGDSAIASGVHLQQMQDPTMEDGALYYLTDIIASSPGRSGGMFRIEKA